MGHQKSGSKNFKDKKKKKKKNLPHAVLISESKLQISSNNKIEEIEKVCGNGSTSRIYRFNKKICKFNYDFQPSHKDLSYVTKKTI